MELVNSGKHSLLSVLMISSLSAVVMAQQRNISGSAFNCPPLERSASTPTSVHMLRPSDIAVVGAMGNSLTAGFGVGAFNFTTIYSNPTDYRGLSWSAGTLCCQCTFRLVNFLAT